jgi:hypothetical protein
VVGDWRRLHEELHKLNFVRVVRSRMMKWAKACGTHGRGEKCIQNLVRKPEGKRSLRRTGHRWEDNIKMDVREIG